MNDDNGTRRESVIINLAERRRTLRPETEAWNDEWALRELRGVRERLNASLERLAALRESLD